ncbi:hypothetical protein KIL84_014320 [Mauremys mutica]|uniref:Uncharacterized protein n=1 Tax=Mauremys mutica TaxID=74926 RepID=A0A9D4B873_9SAUR|nr:hypothetical protein KIL84_014320 [Mauremys mutica]
MEKRYYMPLKGSEFLFSHPPPNSFVIQAATEQACQQHPCSTLADKEGKHLDFLGPKVFSSASLQFRMSNYLALFTKYDFLTYSKLINFSGKLPQHNQA